MRAWQGLVVVVSVVACCFCCLATRAEPLAAESATAMPQPYAQSGWADWMASLRRVTDAMEWSDELVHHDWRVQRRPGSDSCRVLDPGDICLHEGTQADCLKAFEAIEQAAKIPAMDGPTVIVMHGLGEGRASMRPLVRHLREHLKATVLNVGYASPRASIDAHGRSLAAVIAAIPHASRISFVGHSLGNLVVRRWMALAPAQELARVHRMVMLGAPNQGSELARMASKIWVLSVLSNGAARDLVVDWDQVSRDLAVPTCDFGIVAGGKGDDDGYSTFLKGDDDAVVRVAETHLEGADDFLLVPVRHAWMMKNATVQKATVSFLETGAFPEATAAVHKDDGDGVPDRDLSEPKPSVR